MTAAVAVVHAGAKRVAIVSYHALVDAVGYAVFSEGAGRWHRQTTAAVTALPVSREANESASSVGACRVRIDWLGTNVAAHSAIRQICTDVSANVVTARHT
jgi:hypothetical protein